MRPLWPLQQDITYLNHGTVGVTPIEVTEVQDALRSRIESQPAGYLRHDLKPGLRRSATEVARLFGGLGQDYVFTTNATAGINSVLRSLELCPDDEILITSHAYGAVKNAAEFTCREAGAKLIIVEIPFPPLNADVITDIIQTSLSTRTRLVIIDHVTSETALVLPLRDIVEKCHSVGVKVLVDGAHAPGMISLNIPSIGCDWYAANLHKWYFAPRSCGILWASEAAQLSVYPVVISWGVDEGFTERFDWTGTQDFSPYLVFPAAAAFMEKLGAEDVRKYNRDLALAGGCLLAQRFGGELAPLEMLSGSMVLAPLPDSFVPNQETAERIRDYLLFDYQIEVQIIACSNRLWARLAAQVYCEISDYERLADCVSALTTRI